MKTHMKMTLDKQPRALKPKRPVRGPAKTLTPACTHPVWLLGGKLALCHVEHTDKHIAAPAQSGALDCSHHSYNQHNCHTSMGPLHKASGASSCTSIHQETPLLAHVLVSPMIMHVLVSSPSK